MALVGASFGGETLVLTDKGIAAIRETVPPATLQKHFNN
jgi:hypothetical protein